MGTNSILRPNFSNGHVAIPSSPIAKRIFKLALAVSAVAATFYLALPKLASLDSSEIVTALSLFNSWQIGAACIAAIASFAAIATYDRMAIAYSGIELSWRRSALASTTAYATSNMLGFPTITANLIRIQYYRQWGLGLRHVVIASVATSIVTNVVLALIVGVTAIVFRNSIAEVFQLNASLLAAGGLLATILSVSAIVYELRRTQTVTLYRLQLGARPRIQTLLHLLGAFIDYIATTTVLYVLLAEFVTVSFPSFLVIFACASLLAIASNVPAGLGVLEIALLALAQTGHENELIAAMLLFRLFYYVVPFIVTAVVLGVTEPGRLIRKIQKPW